MSDYDYALYQFNKYKKLYVKHLLSGNFKLAQACYKQIHVWYDCLTYANMERW